MMLSNILSPLKGADIFKRDIFVAFSWVLASNPFPHVRVNLHHMLVAHQKCRFRGNFPQSLGRGSTTAFAGKKAQPQPA